jgi:hypothetical protein
LEVQVEERIGVVVVRWKKKSPRAVGGVVYIVLPPAPFDAKEAKEPSRVRSR